MADFPQKKAGERLSAERDWNPVAQRLTELGVEQRKLGSSDYGILYGQATSVAPKYSLLEVYDATVTGNTDEQPVVGVRAPTSGAPVGLMTNGPFPTIAAKPSKIDLVLIGQPIKLDVDPGDTGFVVGEECGPESGSYQLSSDGTGFVCLSAPITYESTRKFVWAAARGGGDSSSSKLVLATSGIPARSGSTAGSATCTEYKIVGSTLTTNTETITIKNIQAEAIPSGLYVFAVKEALSGFWIAQHPGVLNVRWVDPNLQQTKTGTGYTNIDTAEDCT